MPEPPRPSVVPSQARQMFGKMVLPVAVVTMNVGISCLGAGLIAREAIAGTTTQQRLALHIMAFCIGVGKTCMALRSLAKALNQPNQRCEGWQDVTNSATFTMLTCPTTINVLVALMVPKFAADTSKHWHVFIAFVMSMGALAGLTPARSLMQLAATVPVFTFLDYLKHCAHAASPSASAPVAAACLSSNLSALAEVCSAPASAPDPAPAPAQQPCSLLAFLVHLVWRGPRLALAGLLPALLLHIVFIRQQMVDGLPDQTHADRSAREPALAPHESGACMQDEEDEEQEHDWLLDDSSHPPHSMSVATGATPCSRASSALTGLGPASCGPGGRVLGAASAQPQCVLMPAPQALMARLEIVDRWCEALACSVEPSILVLFSCLPLALFYLGRTLLSRIMSETLPVSQVSPDEWLLVMASFFILGRQSCTGDMAPALTRLRARMCTSVQLLNDVLPKHVVQMLLDDAGPGQESAPTLPAATRDHHQQEELCQHLSAESSFVMTQHTVVPFASLTHLPGDASGSVAAHVLSPVVPPACDGEVFEDAHADDRWPSPGSSSKGHARPALSSNLIFKMFRSVGGSTSGAGARVSDARGAHAPAHGGSSLGRVSALPHAGSTDRGSSSPDGYAGLHHLEPHHSQLNVAEQHDCLTIFFSDICGFSTWANKLPPQKVMNTLNDLYGRLDSIILNELPSVYKVETVGDGYVAATNLLPRDPHHAITMVRFAIRAQEEAAKVMRPDLEDGSPLQLRIGVHSGPAMTGIVGRIRRRFCCFGDTINMASRTETSCPPGSIQLTQSTCEIITADPWFQAYGGFQLRARGDVSVKGASAPLRMYLVEAADNDDDSWRMRRGRRSLSFDLRRPCTGRRSMQVMLSSSPQVDVSSMASVK